MVGQLISVQESEEVEVLRTDVMGEVVFKGGKEIRVTKRSLNDIYMQLQVNMNILSILFATIIAATSAILTTCPGGELKENYAYSGQVLLLTPSII